MSPKEIVLGSRIDRRIVSVMSWMFGFGPFGERRVGGCQLAGRNVSRMVEGLQFGGLRFVRSS